MNYKVHVCMVNKNQFSTLVVKAFKSFQIFPVPGGESGQSCRILEPEGHQYAALAATMSSGSTGWRDGPPGRAKDRITAEVSQMSRSDFRN